MNFSLDRLNSVNPARAGMAGVAALDNLSHFTPEQQIAGMAVAFTSLLDKYSVHPSKALEVAQNLLNYASHATPEIRAVGRYVREEL